MNLHNTTLRQKRIEQERKARDRAEKERKDREAAEAKRKPDSSADKYGKNLCKYAWRGNLKRVQRCIRKGGSPEYANPLSLSRPVHRACLGGSLEVVKYLVLEKKVSVNSYDDEEWRPLHFASSKGYPDIVRFLVEQGAQIDAKDNAGNTALHLAASKGNDEVVQLLLSLGASTQERNAQSKLAGELAASRRIARMIAGLGAAAAAEDDDDSADERPVPAPGDADKREGEFFDATTLYGLEFSSDAEADETQQ